MEHNVKGLCFATNGLSSHFSVLSHSPDLPEEVRYACFDLGSELLDISRQLYYAAFIENDAAITELVDAIEAAADDADAINKEIDELTNALKDARNKIKSVTETIADATEKYKEAMAAVERACDEVERILGLFGVKI